MSEGAGRASGASCRANVSAEQYEAVAKIALHFRWDQGGHNSFGEKGILFILRIKAQSSADAHAMCIRNDTALMENISHNEISDLSSDA